MPLIQFMPRIPGTAVSNGGVPMPAVSGVEPEVKFIKGYLAGEPNPGDGSRICGPFQVNCMIVTLEQLFELFYRVRNTRVTGYEIYQEHVTSPSTNTKWTALFNTEGIPARNYTQGPAGSGWTQTVRKGSYFTGESNLTWVEANCGPGYDAGGDTYYDAENERALWPPPDVLSVSCSASHFASSVISASFTPPESYGPYNKRVLPSGATPISYLTGFFNITFSPLVAYVGADSPYSPDATLYVAATFGDTFNGHSSLFSGGLASNVEVVLASGTCLIPFGVRPVSSGYVATVITPPRLEATSWWPHRRSDGVAMWNETTGEPA